MGPGVKRVQGDADINEMLDDNIFLVFSNQLLTLAKTNVQKTCNVKGCQEEVLLTTDTVSSVMYLKWVSKTSN